MLYTLLEATYNPDLCEGDITHIMRIIHIVNDNIQDMEGVQGNPLHQTDTLNIIEWGTLNVKG